MADFFTRLAGRTLGTVPIAQPVIPSMFAPQPLTTWQSSADAAVDGLEMEVEHETSTPVRATQAVSRPQALTEPSVQSPHNEIHQHLMQQQIVRGTVPPIAPQTPTPISAIQESANDGLQTEHLEGSAPMRGKLVETQGDRKGLPYISEREEHVGETLAVSLFSLSRRDIPPHMSLVERSTFTGPEDTTKTNSAISTEESAIVPRSGVSMVEAELAFVPPNREVVYPQAVEQSQDTSGISPQEPIASARSSTPIPTTTTARFSNDGERQTSDMKTASITTTTRQGVDSNSFHIYEGTQQSERDVTQVAAPKHLLIATYDEPQTGANPLERGSNTTSQQGVEQGISSQRREEAQRPDAEMQGIQVIAHVEHSRATGATAATQRSAEYAQPATTPTIHVTIGRIDVRAVSSPTPPEPKSRTGRHEPKVSLNQYLGRQR